MFPHRQKQPTGPLRILHPAYQIYVFISHSGRFGRLFPFSITEACFPMKVLFYVHVFVSGKHQMCSVFVSNHLFFQ